MDNELQSSKLRIVVLSDTLGRDQHRFMGLIRPWTMGAYLGLNQDQIDEQHNVVMFNVLVCEPFAVWTLCESNTFACRRSSSVNFPSRMGSSDHEGDFEIVGSAFHIVFDQAM